MGNYISRYWSTSLPQPTITDTKNLDALDPNSNASKCFQNEQGSPEKLNSQIESDLPPTFVTPKVRKFLLKIICFHIFR